MKQTKVGEVFQTTDYEKFNILGGNRTINKAHVRHLSNSFTKDYLLCPIIVNEKMEIVDGQHRFTAAKELQLPVHYIQVKGYGLKEVQILNTNSSDWSKKEYLESYCDLKHPEYLKLRNFMRQFRHFSISIAITLVENKINEGGEHRRNDSYKHFERGEFKFVDKKAAEERAEKLMMIKPYYDGFNRRSFVAAMLKLFENENYNHSHFIHKLDTQPGVLAHQANTTQYLFLIEDIYNYRSREKVSLRY